MAKYDVFISYAHLDIERVSDIYDFLIGKKVECYIDLKTHHGEDHRNKHQEAISQSQKVVCFLSENSFCGNRLREEIDFELKTAKELDKTVIPFAFDRAFDYYNIPYFKGVSILYQDTYPNTYQDTLLEDIKVNIQLLDYIRDEGFAKFTELQQKANEGNPEMQIKMGDYFRFGKPPEIDYNKAIEWYLKAAQLGDEDSYMALGDCYLKSILPIIERYSLNGIVDPEFGSSLSYAASKAKRAEDWFYKAALSSKHDINGLLDLFEETRWLSYYCRECLPTDRVFDVFSNYGFEDPHTGYRLCRLLFSLSCEMECYHDYDDTEPEILYSEGGEPEIGNVTVSVNHDVIHAAEKAISLLEKWAEMGVIDAILFLSSTLLNLKPDVIPHLSYDSERLYDNAISLLNQAYCVIGDELFRYRLSDYGIREVNRALSDTLLDQDHPNPIGIQVGMELDIIPIERWENRLAGWELSQAEKYYYLGLGALRVDLSFAAMWFTQSKRLLFNEARRLLGDYYAERLDIYDSGVMHKTGAIVNVTAHLAKGDSSGDPWLDSFAERDRDGISSVSKDVFIPMYLRNISTARKFYLDYEQQGGDATCLGWCYYWGLGVQENREKAQELGYSDTLAERDRQGLEPWLDAIAQHKRDEEEAQAWVETLRDTNDDEYPDSNDCSSKDPATYDTNDLLNTMREKAEEWREQFQDIPCPYDSVIRKFKEITTE